MAGPSELCAASGESCCCCLGTSMQGPEGCPYHPFVLPLNLIRKHTIMHNILKKMQWSLVLLTLFRLLTHHPWWDLLKFTRVRPVFVCIGGYQECFGVQFLKSSLVGWVVMFYRLLTFLGSLVTFGLCSVVI